VEDEAFKSLVQKIIESPVMDLFGLYCHAGQSYGSVSLRLLARPPLPPHPIPFFSIPELISIVYSAFLFRLHLHDQNRPNQNGSPKTAIPSRSPRFPNRRDPMRRTSRYSRQRVHRHPPPHVLLRSVLQLQRSGGEEEALRDQRREHTYRLEHIVGRRSQGARRAA
jgi:hypothetical protein